jgi:hypothetical protein
MLSDCMSAEVQEGGEFMIGYFLGCRGLECARDAFALFVMRVPAVLD